jgi:hypothetical protein
MNLEQAKAKLDTISKSTAIQHPKVLVSELCVVVKFLLDEIERVKSPNMVSLLKQPLDPNQPIHTPPPSTNKPDIPFIPHKHPWPDTPKRTVCPDTPPTRREDPSVPPIRRKGNAGDAT